MNGVSSAAENSSNKHNTGHGTSNSKPRVGGGSQYCVLWNNYHGTLVTTLGMLRKEGQLLDCTLACTDGGKIHAHQLILAACSSICREFIRDTGTKHPIILLPSEIGIHVLRAMVEFMYTGQVCIEQERLKSFIHGARYLRIKGLEDTSDDTDTEDIIDSPGKFQDQLEPLDNHTSKTDRVPFSQYNSSDNAGDKKRHAGAEDDAAAEERDNWEVVERKPIILPQARATSPGGSRKRRRLTTSRRRPMHLSNSIVCYEQDSTGGPGYRQSGYKAQEAIDASEPINKIRRMSSQHGHFHDDLEICTCSSRKTWSVADTEALLKVWGETLAQVPPSYFIRSMSLCKRVARNLQASSVRKNWRQCQVKMKNLRREVRLFKESRCRVSSRKPSEVANACEKLLPYIEEIFNKEEEIRQEWYQLKTDDPVREVGEGTLRAQQRNILAEVAVLADSDLGDEDTDGAGLETEGEGETRAVEDDDIVGVEVTTASSTFEGGDDRPHHSVHHQPDGTIHHIVEDVSLHVTKSEHEQL